MPALNLYTAPCVWADPYIDRPSIPYLQVLGASAEVHGTAWARRGPNEESPTTSNTDRLTVPSTIDFSRGLITFLRTYLGTKQSAGPASEGYDCKLFAQWMAGKTGLISPPSALDHAVGIVERGQLTERNLRLGEIGVYGVKHDTSISPIHVVVGAKEDEGLCIQARSYKGDIAVTTQTDVVAYYAALTEILWGGNIEHGLFTAEPVSSA